MSNTSEDNGGQIDDAATALANHVLTSTNQYHVRTLGNSDIEYRAFYLTLAQEENVAYSVMQFLNGKRNALETCLDERPEGFVPSGLSLTIGLEIARRASKIIQSANNRAMNEVTRHYMQKEDLAFTL